MKQTAKAIPMCANALARFFGVVMSDNIALEPLSTQDYIGNSKDLHSKLYVPLTQTSNCPREHVGGKGSGFDPS
jgi:hypothetical protein